MSRMESSLAQMFKHFIFQEFAISKNIQLGDEKGPKFPSVWDWSLQFTAKDRTLFHNPMYIGKSTPCVQNGSVKSFKRTKVSYKHILTLEISYSHVNQEREEEVNWWVGWEDSE